MRSEADKQIFMTQEYVPPLYPANYPECPLGLRCDSSGGLWRWDKDDILTYRPTWRSCLNAIYCQEAVSPWHLPLRRYTHFFNSIKYWFVELYPVPPNFNRKLYRDYIKGYGYAEAWEIPTLSDTTLNALTVTANYFDYGYAQAVPISKCDLHPKKLYKKDEHGL